MNLSVEVLRTVPSDSELRTSSSCSAIIGTGYHWSLSLLEDVLAIARGKFWFKSYGQFWFTLLIDYILTQPC